MSNNIKLRTPIEISGAEVERALFEQAQDEPAIKQIYNRLRSSARAAADELNQALDVDVFELLAAGWAAVPAVRNAVQLSALMTGPPTIVRLDQHNIASTSHPVLSISVGQSVLPELRLRLEIMAGVQDATLAARGGRIELVALGKASIIARLKYKSVLLKEHATGVDGVSRDPFRRPISSPARRADVDIQI